MLLFALALISALCILFWPKMQPYFGWSDRRLERKFADEECQRELALHAVKNRNWKLFEWMARNGLTAEHCREDNCALLAEAIAHDAGADVLLLFEAMGITMQDCRESELFTRACGANNADAVEWMCSRGLQFPRKETAALYSAVTFCNQRVLMCLERMGVSVGTLQRTLVLRYVIECGGDQALDWAIGLGLSSVHLRGEMETIGILEAFAGGRLRTIERLAGLGAIDFDDESFRKRIVRRCVRRAEKGSPLPALSLQWLLRCGFGPKDCETVWFSRTVRAEQTSLLLLAQMGVPKVRFDFAGQEWIPVVSRVLVLILCDRRAKLRRLPPELWELTVALFI